MGPAARGAQFSTIQAAINQAVLDGATFAQPAAIWIYPGVYTENLSIPGGAWAFAGFGSTGQWDVYVDGTITVTNDALTSNSYTFQGIGIQSAVQLLGVSAGDLVAEFEQCQLFGLFSTAEQCLFRAVNSEFRAGISGSTTATPFIYQLEQCDVIDGGPGTDAIICRNLEARGTTFRGRVNVVGTIDITDCSVSEFSLAAIPVRIDGSGSIRGLHVSRATAGQAVLKLGAGDLAVQDLSFGGAVTVPPFSVGAGTLTEGTQNGLFYTRDEYRAQVRTAGGSAGLDVFESGGALRSRVRYDEAANRSILEAQGAGNLVAWQNQGLARVVLPSTAPALNEVLAVTAIGAEVLTDWVPVAAGGLGLVTVEPLPTLMSFGVSSGNQVRAFSWQAPFGFTASRLGCFVTNTSAVEQVTLGVYDAAGTALLASLNFTPNVLGYVDFPLAGVLPIAANTRYWLAMKGNLGAANFGAYNVISNAGLFREGNVAAPGLPASLGALGASGNAVYLYLKGTQP